MQRVLSIERAVLHQFKLVRIVTAVLFCCVVLSLALRTLESNLFNRALLLVCHILSPYGQSLYFL